MAVKFFRFDFGKLAAFDESVGMICSLDKAWTSVGGSVALAKEIVTDEGSVELTEGEAKSALLARGAPTPSFVANDESSLKNCPIDFKNLLNVKQDRT